jgi:hypothetical protein
MEREVQNSSSTTVTGDTLGVRGNFQKFEREGCENILYFLLILPSGKWSFHLRISDHNCVCTSEVRLCNCYSTYLLMLFFFFLAFCYYVIVSHNDSSVPHPSLSIHRTYSVDLESLNKVKVSKTVPLHAMEVPGGKEV